MSEPASTPAPAPRTESGGAWARSIADQYTQIARTSTDPLKTEANAAEAGKYYRIAARMDRSLPAETPEEQPMTNVNHMPPYLGAILADHDRGPEYAIVECIGDDFTCTATERVESSASMTDAEITAVLAQRGWSVGPTLCPEHAIPADVLAAAQAAADELHWDHYDTTRISESRVVTLVAQAIKNDRIAQHLGRQIQQLTDPDTRERTLLRAQLVTELYDDEPDEPGLVIQDIITDLAHLAQLRNVDFDAVLARGKHMAQQEHREWLLREEGDTHYD